MAGVRACVAGAGDDTARGLPTRIHVCANSLFNSDRCGQVRTARQHQPVVLPYEHGGPLRDPTFDVFVVMLKLGVSRAAPVSIGKVTQLYGYLRLTAREI